MKRRGFLAHCENRGLVIMRATPARALPFGPFCLERAIDQPEGLLHEPSVADHDRLAGERVRGESRQKYRCFRDVLYGRELSFDGLLQHDRLDDLRLRDPELARLLRDLLLDQRRVDEAGADHVRTHAMRRSLLRHDLYQADETVFGCERKEP
jgi:hypothetical protein